MPTPDIPTKFISLLFDSDFRISDAEPDAQTKHFQDLKVRDLRELDERLVAELRRIDEVKHIHATTRANIRRQIRGDS